MSDEDTPILLRSPQRQIIHFVGMLLLAVATWIGFYIAYLIYETGGGWAAIAFAIDFRYSKKFAHIPFEVPND